MSQKLATETFSEAFAIARELGYPSVVDIAEGRGEYKVYPSGHCLCAKTRPYHSFDGETCDCASRESGGTIATMRLTP